jgi:hypothetical protein
VVQQVPFSSFAGLMLLSYNGEKGDEKFLAPKSALIRRADRQLKATSSLATAQLVEGKRCKLPLPDGHNGVVHALPFQ